MDEVANGQDITAALWNALAYSILRGWIEIADTWTYASATTITVPTDARTDYEVGMGIRLKQGGGYKYFYIVDVAATVLTIHAGNSYTLTNAVITDVAIAHRPETAVDFPVWFDVAAPTTFTNIDDGASGQPNVTHNKFAMHGRTVHVRIKGDGIKAGSGTSFYYSSNGYPTPGDVDDNTVLGSCFTGGVNLCGVILFIDPTLYFLFDVSIGDNAVLSYFSAEFTYEV